MLKQVIENLDDDGAPYICYRLDSGLFNLGRLHAHTKIIEELLHDLIFADDAALVAHTERALQHLTSCFAAAAQLFGHEVSLKKTEVIHQPAPLEEYRPLHLIIGGTELKAVHPFTYLEVYHHIRCQDRQGSREQPDQSKQRFRQSLQKSTEQVSEEGH